VLAQRELTRVAAQDLNFGANLFFFKQLVAQVIYRFFLVIFYSIDIVMIENMVDDGVEPKPAMIDVKPIVESLVNVKIPFQAYIQAKPTGAFKLRDYEVNTASFFFNK